MSREHLPCWVDNMSQRTMLHYAAYFRPAVGYNPWLEAITNGKRFRRPVK